MFDVVNRAFRGRVVDYALGATGADTTGALVPSSATKTLYIKKIITTVSTYAANVLTFGDNAGTAVVLGKTSIPAAAPTASGLQTYVHDFGDQGIPLTVGKNFSIARSATGAAAIIHVEAYEK